ncbi:NAD-dependent epimerase/dehydratase family protein [Shewanella fidelis]|uniref:NAD-dependent epimerase/dehydratase family protein n=1 Tax=Shewanella fidelis TaxID=173509 RepID=A0AAW8NRQ8_9GAMM|nr:NAD-dependent epimerase/dehydratase family protein [Shewanella fidelis]MDR8524418.1 NAD-dependent epimerase/dehydratase family protein [Shewanella fidelis]MDW4811894.1 NAD-dependent epimerase/dehydratase family protein [Shewanella fidelis]MDW4817167.1 NAD-dependent epimerase/dehydratase family protein [Shewanella fidelis]MDW4821237.1 NAD-dependent epimerase/dehydratase family protein [Shewanella fidelis]MDW4822500.1 NAD-dependent epimerase/dehydratase family protein [Shewanella fidelis]
MKVLITGSKGFIGEYLTRELEKECELVLQARSRRENELKNFYEIDIDSKSNWRECLHGVDVIVHLASVAHNKSNDIEYIKEVNVNGTLNLAKQAVESGVKRFVFVSSIGVNGNSTSESVFLATSKANPHNCYAQSKHDAEIGLKNIGKDTGLEIVIVRPTLVYGPNAPGNFRLLTNLVKLAPFLPFGLARNMRDFIYVKNLTSLLVECAKHPNAPGSTFLASDGKAVSIKTFTNLMAKGLNKRIIQIPVPTSLMLFCSRLLGKVSIGQQLLGNLQVDSTNAQDILGWVPPFTMKQAMASLSENKK